ncbi:hypothetical protein L6452_26287 [Arctium lappa]|uniref:Uncharacterized protein n=1 Tax=Arctium lappa TaxID=4217 RepID=A0ACB9ACI0_ARCLA|nr:hypothetical protein L6452_26287 [Arctium lappa]
MLSTRPLPPPRSKRRFLFFSALYSLPRATTPTHEILAISFIHGVFHAAPISSSIQVSEINHHQISHKALTEYEDCANCKVQKNLLTHSWEPNMRLLLLLA